MPVVPTPPTIYDEITPSSKWNQFRDAIRFLQRPPHAGLLQTVAQSLPSGVNAAISFDFESVDDDIDGIGGHDNTQPTRYTARYPGWYWLDGGIGYASNATGLRTVEWVVNGVVVSGSGVIVAGISGAPTRVAGRGILVYLTAGDYVEALAFQNSGGPLNTAVSGIDQSSLAIKWVSI